jgi:hypothetical protein
MAGTDDNHNTPPEAASDYIELDKALLDWLADPSGNQEVEEHLRRLGQPLENVSLSPPEARLHYTKHKLYIEHYDNALGNGDLVAELWPPPAKAIAGAREIRLLKSQWCAYGPEQRRRMIIGGVILASAGDELMPCDHWRIMLKATSHTAWRKRQAHKRGTAVASSVDQLPAVAEQTTTQSPTPISSTPDEPPREVARQELPDVRPPLPTTPAELSLKEALSQLSDTENDVYKTMKTDPPFENERAYATKLWNRYFKKKVGPKRIQNIVSKLRNMPALWGDDAARYESRPKKTSRRK